MKISFKQTGGFGGITLNKDLEVDSSNLDLVRKLVQQIASLPKSNPVGLPDMQSYHFEIEDDGQQSILDVDDSHSSEAVNELVNFILERL